MDCRPDVTSPGEWDVDPKLVQQAHFSGQREEFESLVILGGRPYLEGQFPANAKGRLSSQEL